MELCRYGICMVETNMMISYHAVPVIVDAYHKKGIGNLIPEKALGLCCGQP